MARHGYLMWFQQVTHGTLKLGNLVYECLVAQSCPMLCDPIDCSLPAPLSMGGFSRQEYWSGLPCPPPGNLLNPGIEPRSPVLQTDSLPSESRGIFFISWLHCASGIFVPHQQPNPGSLQGQCGILTGLICYKDPSSFCSENRF